MPLTKTFIYLFIFSQFWTCFFAMIHFQIAGPHQPEIFLLVDSVFKWAGWFAKATEGPVTVAFKPA